MNDLVVTEKIANVLSIGLNRPSKRNALNPDMFQGLARAYTELCDDSKLRCGVLYSTTDIFCSGLDLMEMGPVLMGQAGDTAPSLWAENQVDPFNWASIVGRQGRLRSKPLITAINGRCIAGGMEVCLATDIIVAEEDVTFAQAEIRRGLMPFGGAVERFVSYFGWGNAMRWLLTGDEFDVVEAHRIGMVQEIVVKGQAFTRAMEIASRIASAAPLGVQGTLHNAYIARTDGVMAAANQMQPYVLEHISPSKDLAEGITAMFEKREPIYRGE